MEELDVSVARGVASALVLIPMLIWFIVLLLRGHRTLPSWGWQSRTGGQNALKDAIKSKDAR